MKFYKTRPERGHPASSQPSHQLSHAGCSELLFKNTGLEGRESRARAHGHILTQSVFLQPEVCLAGQGQHTELCKGQDWYRLLRKKLPRACGKSSRPEAPSAMLKTVESCTSLPCTSSERILLKPGPCFDLMRKPKSLTKETLSPETQR